MSQGGPPYRPVIETTRSNRQETRMSPRLNPYTGAYLPLVQPLIDYGQTIQARLEPKLAHLVKIRASQINGCAICLHMHAEEARKHGESEERIRLLDAWREAPLYTPRERAALGWTEALTRLSETKAPDEDYQAIKSVFSEEEQVNLTLLIGAINSFNKLGVGFRLPPLGLAARQAA
jgi:AhpD family alkylhydroperoxidase